MTDITVIPHPGTNWSDYHDTVRIFSANKHMTQFYRDKALCELPTFRFVRQFHRVANTPAVEVPAPAIKHPLLDRIAALRGLAPARG